MDAVYDFISMVKAFETTFHCQVTLHARPGKLNPFRTTIQSLHNNKYCSYIKEKVELSLQCKHFDDTLVYGKLQRGNLQPFFKYCHAGVLELVFPVRTHGGLSGVLYVGPFQRTNASEPLPLDILVSKTCCIDADEAQTHFSELPELTSEKADRLFKMAQLLLFKMESIADSETALVLQGESRKDRIDRFLNHCFKHADSSLVDLAKFMSLSPSRMTQVLSEEFGHNFPYLLNRKRIDYALTLLRETYFSGSQIAYLVGFSSPAYFFRVFKKMTDMTTVQYRKAHCQKQSDVD